jgi:hypothetical protein
MDFTKFCQCFILANVFLEAGMLHGNMGTFPSKENGIQVLAGLASSSQTVGYLFRTQWLVKLAGQIWQHVSLVEKYNQQLLIKCIYPAKI